MSDAPSAPTSDSERATLFASWLKPLTPVRQTRNTTVAKIAPWRREFVAAQKAGFSWSQLAKDIASRPEIGVKVTGRTLMEYVIEAYRQAGEPLDLADTRRVSRPRRKRATTAAGDAVSITTGALRASP